MSKFAGSAASTGLPYSKSRINKAGRYTREHWAGRAAEFDVARFLEELDVVAAFRKAHAVPLTRVAANLRYYVQRHAGEPLFVAQRLKRLPTILEKLSRLGGMELSRMEDIGGCRAVVDSEAQIRAIVGHLKQQRRWAITRERDRIAEPHERTGYRAYHLVVAKDACAIEVQLRTSGQHDWAEYVEEWDRQLPTSFGLKAGTAPDDIQEYFRLGADIISAHERDEDPPRDTAERFRELHRPVMEKLRESVLRKEGNTR